MARMDLVSYLLYTHQPNEHACISRIRQTMDGDTYMHCFSIYRDPPLNRSQARITVRVLRRSKVLSSGLPVLEFHCAN